MEEFTMIYTYNELLLKYKSAYQIEKAVKNSVVYKIEKLKYLCILLACPYLIFHY